MSYVQILLNVCSKKRVRLVHAMATVLGIAAVAFPFCIYDIPNDQRMMLCYDFLRDHLQCFESIISLDTYISSFDMHTHKRGDGHIVQPPPSHLMQYWPRRSFGWNTVYIHTSMTSIDVTM